MEVRGGVGYIEEWADPRLVRDAHLGSIWEGTSNIVALDVARATRREGALASLGQYVHTLLDDTALPPATVALLRNVFERASAALDSVAECGRDENVREAAGAVYNATTAVFMATEAARLAPDFRRLALAHLIVEHKLLPRDPLAPKDVRDDAPLLRRLVDETPVSLDAAMSLMPTQEGGAR